MAKTESTLLPVYFITGADDLKRNHVITRLRERVGRMGDLSFNHSQLVCGRAHAQDVIDACNTVPFMSNLRLVELDDVQSIKKADAEALIEYIQAPNPYCVLALISTGTAKNTRLYKAVAARGKSAIIDCASPKRKELPTFVRELATSHGMVLTEAASFALVDLVGEDTYALNAQLKKIALAHVGSDPVSDGEIRALVARVSEPKPWELTDALGIRNLEKAMQIYSQIKSSSPISLLAMCVTRVRDLMMIRSLGHRHALAQVPEVLGKPEWACRPLIEQARKYSNEELYAALASARDADALMKSGGDAHEVFIDWIVGTIRRR